MKDETRHTSVVRNEIVALFREELTSVGEPLFFDGTLGGGGHTEALLDEFPTASVVACDQDESAIRRACAKLERFGGRLTVIHENFRSFAKHSARKFDGAILDLGISSDQLDDRSRGFSFQGEGELDMRMDRSKGKSAAEILNTASAHELSNIFKLGGLRRNAESLAKRIVEARPIKSVRDLSLICEDVLGSPRERRLRKARGGSDANPATVPFQALRIAVNDELGAVEDFLDHAEELMNPGGVLAIITFHSLEDEAVTTRFRKWSRSEISSRFLPAVPAGTKGAPIGKHLTQKPIFPSEEEISSNPRARSARLRAFKFGVTE